MHPTGVTLKLIQSNTNKLTINKENLYYLDPDVVICVSKNILVHKGDR